MGVSANQARLMTLTSRLHDLELRAQTISAQKMVLAMQTQSAATAYSNSLNDAMKGDGSGNFDSSKIDTSYSTTITNLSASEKLLDLELTQINTEHTAVNTEYDSIKSLISDNVDKSFNVFG